jgi:hypothetical protein
MKKVFVLASLVFVIGATLAMAQSVGNPIPGVPHDTVIIHVQKAENGAKGCTSAPGGHSLFLRAYAGVVPPT